MPNHELVSSICTLSKPVHTVGSSERIEGERMNKLCLHLFLFLQNLLHKFFQSEQQEQQTKFKMWMFNVVLQLLDPSQDLWSFKWITPQNPTILSPSHIPSRGEKNFYNWNIYNSYKSMKLIQMKLQYKEWITQWILFFTSCCLLWSPFLL